MSRIVTTIRRSEPTAAMICRALDRSGRRGCLDRSRPGLNVSGATPLPALRVLIETGAVGAVLVWQGRRLVGLLDRARLADYELHHRPNNERRPPHERP